MPSLLTYDVAIVGLGPVGATLSALLGERRVVVLERDTAAHTLPRAAHLDGHALQILRSAGVAVDGRPLDGFDLVDRDGRLLFRGRPREALPAGAPAGLLVHQPTVERALRQRLAELGVETRLGHTVEYIRQQDDGAVVAGTGPDGPFTVEARVVVGCDGARSVVRETIGGALRGGGFEQPWLVVDILVRRPQSLPDRLLQIADPARPTTYVPFADPRRRWEFKLLPGEDPDALRQPETVRKLLAPHVDPDAVEIERAVVYTFHDLVATRWRRGPLAIAGDAAHQMPPFLGQGLGAGLRDVAALAPRLLDILDGAPLSVLDGYGSERQRHVESVVRQAVRLGRLVTLPEPWAALRDRTLRAAHRAGGLHRRLLDVRG
ncbi:MAG: FAD-dependent monooxygenase [Bacteroidota bacterium]